MRSDIVIRAFDIRVAPQRETTLGNSDMGGSLPHIVVGMISIGIAGYLSSSAIRWLGDWAMPWRRLF